ncbi:MAG: LON peptidase substrate-binding domain-containing protein, partial [Candidatus Thorarchaeota archaeon]
MSKNYSPVFEDIDFDSELPLLPIRNMIMFPGAVVPLDVGRAKSVAIIDKLEHLDNQVIALFSQKDPEVDDPSEDDLYDVGCAVKVVKVLKHTSGNYSVIVQGISRIEIEDVLQSDPFMKVNVRRIPEDNNGYDVELEALAIALKDTAKQVVSLLPELPQEAVELIDSIQEPNRLADLIAANIDTPPEDKYKILESIDIKTRMNQVMNLLTRQLEILKMRERINSQI